MTESVPAAEHKKELHTAIVRKVVGIILAAPDKEELPWGITAESKEMRGDEPVASFAAYSEARLCERDPARHVSVLADFALLGADAEVRDEQDKLIWHCEADTPVSSDPPSVQPVIVTNWR